MQVREHALRPHHTFFLVGVYFNPKTLELHDKIFFIPSEQISKIATRVGIRNNEQAYRITVPLTDNTRAELAKYLVKKPDFVNKIFEKFSEIEKYYK